MKVFTFAKVESRLLQKSCEEGRSTELFELDFDFDFCKKWQKPGPFFGKARKIQQHSQNIISCCSNCTCQVCHHCKRPPLVPFINGLLITSSPYHPTYCTSALWCSNTSPIAPCSSYCTFPPLSPQRHPHPLTTGDSSRVPVVMWYLPSPTLNFSTYVVK